MNCKFTRNYPHCMSIEEELQSRSCKERANAINSLEKAWLSDKNSYNHVIPVLLKEKNVVVLEQLIPSFKVIPYSDEIAEFVIQNLRTAKLKMKIFDYLNCKEKHLNEQILFNNLSQKNPKFVETILFYLISYFKNRGMPNEHQLELVRQTLFNSDSNVRKNAIELMKILYDRNKQINLEGLKPIIVKDIQEGIRIDSSKSIEKSFSQHEFTNTQKIGNMDNNSMTIEEKNKLIAGLNNSKWKIRLETAEFLNETQKDITFLTDEINKRLKDPNIQIFSVILELIEKKKLNCDRGLLINRLSDKKLQEKIKKSNLIDIYQTDFQNYKNPDIIIMLIDILIQKKNYNFKETVNSLGSSARKELRDKVKEYAYLCDHPNFVIKNQKNEKVKKIPSQKQEESNIVDTPILSQQISENTENLIDLKMVMNIQFIEPVSSLEQKNITEDFFYRYNFFTEKDFKKKLEKIQNYENELKNDNNFLKFVFAIKEHNKMVNLKFLDILSNTKNIEPMLFCHTFVKCFTDTTIFKKFLGICQSMNKKKVILFFLRFIQINKKGKLFERGIEVIKHFHQNMKIDTQIFNLNNYMGKEKQILNNLIEELKNENLIEEKNSNISTHDDQQHNQNDNDLEDTLIHQFESSVILEEQQTPKKLIPEYEPHKNNQKHTIKTINRIKDGKNIKKYFNQDIHRIFKLYKIEASDFIIKYIFEEKKCLCGIQNGVECCLKTLIDYYSEQRYVLNSYEADKFVRLIQKEESLQDLEKIYPKSKITALKSKINNFKDHLSKSFRYREYNMSPFKKKNKCTEENTFQTHNEKQLFFPLVQATSNNLQGTHYVINDSFNNSLINDSFSESNKKEFYVSEKANLSESLKIEKLHKNTEKKFSINTLNNFLITDLYKKDKSALASLLQRAKSDLSSLFYISNSLMNALFCNFDDPITIQILMILSADKNFLSEIDFQTMRMLHLEIMKDIQEKGGDIIINLCLNAPVPLLMRVYLDILNKNKEIILKLIWRNSKRKYLHDSNELLDVFEEFFSKNPILDDLTFKIIQLHISEIVSNKGRIVLNLPITGKLRRIIEGMIEKTKGM